MSTKRRRTIIGTGIVAGGLLVFAPGLEAQETCTYCSYSLGKHQFSGATCTENDPGCWGCSDTPEGHIGCHAFSWDGECGDGHTECGEHLLALQDELLRAVESGDARLIAHVITLDMDRRIHVNAGREALQVASCTGALVAHIPLPRQLFAALYETALAQ